MIILTFQCISGFGIPQGLPGLTIPSQHAGLENAPHGAFGLPKVSLHSGFTDSSLLRSPIGDSLIRSNPSQYTSDALKSSQEDERALLNLMNSNQLALELSGPPPAHSGANNQSISRNPLAAENLVHHQPFSVKLQNQSEPLKIAVPSSKVGYGEMRSPTSTLLYGLTSPGLEDRSQTQFSVFTSTQTAKPEQFSRSQSLNYDPVSPVSDVGQQNEDFAHVNFHELTQIEPSRNSMKLNQNSVIMQHMNVPKSASQDLGSDPSSFLTNHHFMHGSPTMHHNQGVPSPVQNSPHTHSPHVPPARESPQLQPPAATLASPPSVQSIPDSRTKSKKSNILMRSRSRDEGSIGRSQLQEIPSLDSVDVATSNQSFSLAGSYSYCGTRNSPQNLNSFSPQSYSPHMQQQLQGNYQSLQNGRHSNSSLGSNNSPVINDYSSLPQTVIGTQNCSVPVVSHSMENSSMNHRVLSSSNSVMQSNSQHMSGLSSHVSSQSLSSSNQMHISSMQRPPVIETQPSVNYTSNSESSMKSSLGDPLGIPPLGLAGNSNFQVSTAESSMYGNEDNYNNRFDMNGSCLGFQENQRRTSTIDEDALSSLIGSHPTPSQYPTQMPLMQDQGSGSEEWNCANSRVLSPSKTVAVKPELDDEFAHLQKPPNKSVVDTQSQRTNSLFQNQTPYNKPPPPPAQKPEIKKNPNSGFLNSFLSFIQGKKPETLSSVNTSVVKRPELPKYIPEPPRPKAVQKDRRFDSDSTSPKPDVYQSSIHSPSTSQASTIFSEDEEPSITTSGNKVQGIVQQISEDGKPSLKMKISLGRGRGSEALKHRTGPQKGTKPKHTKAAKKKRREDFDEDYIMSSGNEDNWDDFSPNISASEKSSVTKRQLSSRKAKEKAQQKSK